MKASVQYNDLIGTAAADITDGAHTHSLEDLGNLVGIDQERYTVVGISIYGVERPYISFICVDKQLSTPEKEYIVKISFSEVLESVEQILKRLEVVLYSKYDTKYPEIDEYREITFEPEDEEEE